MFGKIKTLLSQLLDRPQKNHKAVAPVAEDAKPAIPSVEAAPEPKPKKIAAPLASADDPIWAGTRIDIAQEIWGDGFCSPGGLDFTLSLAKHFSPLVSGMSFADMNANLGGAMTAIGKKYNLTVHGYESYEPLLRAGQDYLKRADALNMPLKHYHPDKVILPKDAYDCVLIREFLFQVEHQEAFLNKVCDSLKDRGQLLITDFVREKDGAPSGRFNEWVDMESRTPYVLSLDGTLDMLKKRNDMEVRAADNISKKYIKEITVGWKKYLDKIVEDLPDPSYLPWLLREVTLWAKRIEILQSGEVALYRIYARRKPAMERKKTP